MSNHTGARAGEDGLLRTPWALSDPLLLHYYDNEWGEVVDTDQGVFERLSLEAFQAGLSWLTILRKREKFRKAFYDFDIDRVANISNARVEKLMLDPGIVRNRMKIEAARTNARAAMDLRQDGGLAEFVWSFQPDVTPMPRTQSEIPASTPESKALSKALKKRGFAFVGPTTMFALMEAIGIVDTHVLGSFRRGCSGVWPK